MVAPNKGVSLSSARVPPVMTPDKLRAVELLAEGSTPIEQVAKQLGLNRRTLWTWRQEPAFLAALKAYEAELEQDSLRFAIARRRERLSDYDQRRFKFLQIVAKRAAWFAENRPDVPGGETGLLQIQLKVVGSGPAAYTVEEYLPDVALSRELRELNRAAATELGQWSEKTQVEAQVAQRVQIVERQVHHLPPRDIGALRTESVEADYKEVTNEQGIQQLRESTTAHAQSTAEPEPTYLAQLVAKYAPDHPPFAEVRHAKDLDRAAELQETEADRIQRLTGRH